MITARNARISIVATAAVAVCMSAAIWSRAQAPVAPAVQKPAPANYFSTPRTLWIAGVLKRIQTIKPGSTRGALLKVFTTEGGLSTGLWRRYVYDTCPYIKVDVDFRAVGRPDRDPDGRETLKEDPADIIVKISRPYLEWTIAD